MAEQYKNQPDVLFLSLNIDDNPGLVAPFVKQHKLTFPVLPAYDYASNTLKVDLIPENWIVGPHGFVRLKLNGYDAAGNFGARMKEAIEQVSKTTSVALGNQTMTTAARN